MEQNIQYSQYLFVLYMCVVGVVVARLFCSISCHVLMGWFVDMVCSSSYTVRIWNSISDTVRMLMWAGCGHRSSNWRMCLTLRQRTTFFWIGNNFTTFLFITSNSVWDRRKITSFGRMGFVAHPESRILSCATNRLKSPLVYNKCQNLIAKSP